MKHQVFSLTLSQRSPSPLGLLDDSHAEHRAAPSNAPSTSAQDLNLIPRLTPVGRSVASAGAAGGQRGWYHTACQRDARSRPTDALIRTTSGDRSLGTDCDPPFTITTGNGCTERTRAAGEHRAQCVGKTPTTAGVAAAQKPLTAVPARATVGRHRQCRESWEIGRT